MGAEAIDLDTIKSYARFAYVTPRKFPFAKFDKTAQDAGYTLKKVTLETRGTIGKAHCSTCVTEALFLKVDKTGQLIELSGKIDVGRHVIVRGELNGWRDSLPELSIDMVSEAPGGR